MNHQYIASQDSLLAFCDRLKTAKAIYFDTEFVSEDTYTPDLCLIQIAVEDDLALIDPKDIEDMTPFWEVLADGSHVTVAHSGREELLFCYRAIGRKPANLFDTQIAAGLIGLEYPCSFGNLNIKMLDVKLPKGETRSDWRVRPLTSNQIDYALNDVIYLKPLHEKLARKIDKLNRNDWMQEEIDSWESALIEAVNKPRWRNVSGTGNLGVRSLAVVKALWHWRDNQARKMDLPPRRVFRDDLIAELARRKSADPKHIKAIRGMQRRDNQNRLEELAECIQTALDLPDSECPRSVANAPKKQYTVLGQFLNSALGSICREAKVAPSLACTVQDVRDLISYHLDGSDTPPKLTQGWRASVVGQTIEDLLDGTRTISIGNPRAVEPLVFHESTDSK
ncbi:MAG: ribonuclease D [Blastopirellula sp.]|nr:MAG: ribonuclease D [Blastopirellula sp.]